MLLGVLSVLPALYTGFFVVVVQGTSYSTADNREDALMVPQGVLFPMHGAAILLIAVLLVVFVRHVNRNGRIDQDRRAFWVRALLIGHVVAFPVYWWLYMRPRQAASSARLRG